MEGHAPAGPGADGSMIADSEASAAPELGKRVAAALHGAWCQVPPPLRFSPDDLAEITPLLSLAGGAALTWWRLRHSGLKDSPAALELKQSYRLHTLRAIINEARVQRAFSVLQSVGVKPLLAKGWAVARLYPEPGLRPYGDTDLYLRSEEYDAAVRALRDPDTLRGPVDLHRGFPELDDRSPDELYARSQRVKLGGVEVRILGPEDHLRLLCLHLLRHGASRALWLCDIGVALESRHGEFEWEYFLGGNPRRTDYVVCALGLADQLLGARLEGTPVAERVQKLPSWLVPAVLEQWGTGFRRRQPVGTYLRRPAGALEELSHHWPNPIEGTVGVGGPFNELPRLPFQVAHTLARTAQFSIGLPRVLWYMRLSRPC